MSVRLGALTLLIGSGAIIIGLVSPAMMSFARVAQLSSSQGELGVRRAEAGCRSDLFNSLNADITRGDDIDGIVSRLKAMKVNFSLSDAKLRTFIYSPDAPLPSSFTLGINNELPARRDGIFTVSEIMLLNFMGRRLDTFTCKLAATGP